MSLQIVQRTGFCRKVSLRKIYQIIGVSMGKEMVNHPGHYGGDTEYECIKVLEAWNTPEEFLGFCKDNAIKYLCRSGKKDTEIQEWKKALWYIQKGIEYMGKHTK